MKCYIVTTKDRHPIMINLNQTQPPKPRKEIKLSHLTLFWPVTAKIGTIGIYKLDANGFRLIRVLHGCQVH